MPDDADELILKMQHLEAQARAAGQARSVKAGAERVKTQAQKMAFDAQEEVSRAEADLRQAEEKQQRARSAGMPTLEAADLLTEGRTQAQDAQGRLVKARARLNFALDRMDEVERAEWQALQAEARAETHGQLADDPLLKKP